MGCQGGCCGRGCCGRMAEPTEGERVFLERLAQIPFLPVARLIIASSRIVNFEAVALEPVFLDRRSDTRETVLKTGQALKGLARYGAVSLDYDQPLKGFDDAPYRESDLYKAFCEAVEEGARRPGFLLDTPRLECGSLALTGLGQVLGERWGIL